LIVGYSRFITAIERLPIMSFSKSYNKNTGVTYVYEVLENKWDPVKKRAVNKRKLIGKIDPETGKVVPTRKKGVSVKSGGIC